MTVWPYAHFTDNPHTIEEVRRVLLEHIATFDAAQLAAHSAADSGGARDERERDIETRARPTVAPAP